MNRFQRMIILVVAAGTAIGCLPVPGLHHDHEIRISLNRPAAKEVLFLSSLNQYAPVSMNKTFSGDWELYLPEDKAFDYWKKLDANIHHYNTSGSACVTQAGLGEIAIGIAFSHDILAKGSSKGYPVKGTFPSEGTGYEIGGLGLVKGGPEPELGKKFIDWTLSKRAQDLMQVWFRIPLNPEAEIAAGATKASEVKLINYDDEWAGNNNKRLIEKWRQMIGK